MPDDFSGLPLWLQLTLYAVLGSLVIGGAIVQYFKNRRAEDRPTPPELTSVGIAFNDSRAVMHVAEAIEDSGKRNAKKLDEVRESIEELRVVLEEALQLYKLRLALPAPPQPPRRR